MKADSYNELYQFFGCYFNQDWDIEADTSDGVLDVFIADQPERDVLAHTADLIDTLIAEFPDEKALERALFEEIRCEYDPRPDPDGQSVRNWLRGISRKLRAASERAS